MILNPLLKGRVYLFDTFEGFDNRDLKGRDSKFSTDYFNNPSINTANAVIGKDYLNNCELITSYFPKSMPTSFKSKKFSVVSLDAD